MKKSLCLLIAAGGLWANMSFADTPAEVRALIAAVRRY